MSTNSFFGVLKVILEVWSRQNDTLPLPKLVIQHVLLPCFAYEWKFDFSQNSELNKQKLSVKIENNHPILAYKNDEYNWVNVVFDKTISSIPKYAKAFEITFRKYKAFIFSLQTHDHSKSFEVI